MSLRSNLSHVFACTLAFATLLTPTLSAQQPKVLAPHKPVPPRVENSKPWPKPASLRSMVGGMWMTDANFKSSIYLKNGNGISSLTVGPILYLSNGTRYTLPSVTLEPSGTAVVNINDALRDKGIAPWATLVGYLEVQYNSFYDPLCAVINNVDTEHSLIFTSSLRPAQLPPRHASGAPPQSVHAFEGMWWKEESTVSGFVALSNTMTQTVHASIEVSDGAANLLGTHAVTISPHGTKIVNLDEMQAAKTSDGGLRISYDGPEEGLIVNGELEDTSKGYSASMAVRLPLMDSEKPTVSTFAELGLMTGAADPMMSFPAGTEFKPFSVLRNISSAPVTVTPSFYWMQGSSARSAQLKSFVVQPSQTISLDVRSLLGSAGLGDFNGTVNLILDLNGKPHSLLMASGSVDQTKTYVFQVIPRAVRESMSKTISYWSTGNGDDTMVTVWNPADEAQDFVFTLFYSGGHYDLPIHLEARATRMFNVSEVIQNQIPDSAGSVIPTSIHDGSARISGSQGEVQDILVAIDAGTYNVRKATCSYYCIWCDGYIDGALSTVPFSVAKTNTRQLNVTALWDFGTQYNLNSQASWSSTKTTVATVKTGLVSGVAVGATTVTGTADEPYYYQYCAYDPTSCPPDYQSEGGSGPGTVTPSIGGISPSSWNVGSIVPETISGQGLSGGTVTVGDGTTITTSGTVASDTSITTDFNIPSSAPAGSYAVSVSVPNPDGGKLTSNSVTFTALRCGVPTNFQQQSCSDQGNGDLHFVYTWGSSTGSLADLQGCTVGEIVTYPGTQNPWPFPSPPFPPDAYSNPTVSDAPATSGTATDDHFLTPSTTFVKPYSASSFTATQYYRYKCTCSNSDNYVNIEGPLSIVRSVSKNTNGSWKFTVTKSSCSATINPLP